MRQSLHLVHDPGVDPVAALESARHLVQHSSERFEGDLQLHVTPGPLAESLLQIAQREEATMMVIAVPEFLTRAWCAQTAQELLRRAPVPLLMVCESVVFEGWASGTRPLVAVLDADFSEASRRASRWVEKLAKLGPCELVIVHTYETLGDPLRRAVGAHALAGEATARASVERELRRCFAPLEGDLQLRTRLVPRRAPDEVQLAECAIEEAADLVVLGYDAAERSDEGLISQLYTLLQTTDCSLLCVPGPAGVS